MVDDGHLDLSKAIDVISLIVSEKLTRSITLLRTRILNRSEVLVP